MAFTKTTPATATPEQPESNLVRSLKYDERQRAIAAATARRAAISADLADARILAETARKRMSVAQANWDANDSHTSEEAIRLEARQREATATAAQVDALAKQLDEVEGDLRALTQDAKREANIRLVQETWTPARKKMAAAARAFHQALREQAAVLDQLDDAGARGLIDQAEELIMADGGVSDTSYVFDPCLSISRYLAQCAKDGIR